MSMQTTIPDRKAIAPARERFDMGLPLGAETVEAIIPNGRPLRQTGLCLIRTSGRALLQAGDRLWVREDFRIRARVGSQQMDLEWLADPAVTKLSGGKQSSVFAGRPLEPDAWAGLVRPAYQRDPAWVHRSFMPRQASRLTLVVRKAYRHALQDISLSAMIDSGVHGMNEVNVRTAFIQRWDARAACVDETWSRNPAVVSIRFDAILANIGDLS
jgi:hypothetical protein